jgi:GT2 family glycosyltransferase
VRRAALEQIVAERGMFFDESLKMYKEDVEVCLFARRLGWRLRMFGDLSAHHQRGWSQDRKSVPYWRRQLSARNDIIVASRYRPHTLPYALAKWAYVRWLEAR